MVAVGTRTRSWRSRADAEFQNRTIRELKRRFGGTFRSDRGANRYFPLHGPDRREAEAGAFRAFSIFGDNYASAGLYIQNMPIGDSKHRELPEVLRFVFPVVNASNMIVPFFVAITEEYFRSTYVALLRYSPKRDDVLRNIRLTAAEAAQIRDDGELLEEVVARTKMSFQNLERVQSQFKALNSRYDVAGWLRQPYRSRQETPYDTLSRLVSHRHALVHRAVILSAYDNVDADRDLKSIRAGVNRIYTNLVGLHGWSAEAA